MRNLKSSLQGILTGSLVGIVVGVVLMIPFALWGANKGGLVTALAWARGAGLAAGGIGLVFAGMRLFSSDREHAYFWRPGRPLRTLEEELHEETIKRGSGQKSCQEVPRKISSLWVAVGMVLSCLIPEILVMILL